MKARVIFPFVIPEESAVDYKFFLRVRDRGQLIESWTDNLTKGKSMVVRKRAFPDETDRRPSLKDIAFARRWTQPCDLDSHVERSEVAFAGGTENVIWDVNGTKRDDDYNRDGQRVYNSASNIRRGIDANRKSL